MADSNLGATKDEILSKLDVKAELESMGIKFAGNLGASGWHPCHDPYRPDVHPSDSVFLGSGQNCGLLMRRGQSANNSVSFWDLARDFHSQLSGADFGTILRHFADQVGVKIKGSKRDDTRELIATYDYTDKDGTVVHQTLRYHPKDFKQRRPDGKGGWIWDLKNIEVVPYNLPAVIDSEQIYICEGEKAADAVNALGDSTATCGPMGAKKFWPSFIPYYKNKDLVILEDNDIEGKAHTIVLLKNLFAHARSIRVVHLPDLPEKGDVYDWLVDQKHTRDDLVKITNDTPVEREFNDPVLALNESHAVIMVGGKCLILNEFVEPVFDRPDINFSTVYDFKHRYSNRKVPNTKDGPMQPKEISVADAWLDDSDRRQYDGIVFDPEYKSSDDYYNLFRGFAMEPREGDWSKYQDHICDIICDDNDEYAEWLFTWIARIIQEPGGKRPGTCIVLRGGQGTGKGCFVSILGRIFGSHFLHINNQNRVTSNFNQHLKDAILVFVDEGFWAGDKSAEGVLKGMVTEDHVLIEPKGKDAFPVKNHVNMIMASNNDWVVPAGPDERRFAVFDVSDRHQKDKPYFKAIFNQMLRRGGCEAMLYDLLEFDLADHRKRYDIGEIPRTHALLDQILHSMNPAQKFWFDRLREGTLLPDHENWTGDVQATTFHHSYIRFSDDIGMQRNKKFDYQFLKELRKVCPDIERVRMSVDTTTGTRPWLLKFPSLEECRDLFRETLDIDVDFESDDNMGTRNK